MKQNQTQTNFPPSWELQFSLLSRSVYLGRYSSIVLLFPSFLFVPPSLRMLLLWLLLLLIFMGMYACGCVCAHHDPSAPKLCSRTFLFYILGIRAYLSTQCVGSILPFTSIRILIKLFLFPADRLVALRSELSRCSDNNYSGFQKILTMRHEYLVLLFYVCLIGIATELSVINGNFFC